MHWAAEYRSVMSPLYEGCIKYSSPRVRYLGGGLAAGTIPEDAEAAGRSLAV